ncbi:MAG: XRE family transcriptional regulator [Eubacterium sp.]|nr:XRE family transcriptional regulator [Eubacterium sp.]
MESIKIGQRLKALRQNRSLTLDDVSELTNVSKPMLGQIERGQSSPTVNTLWKIATGMKVPFSYFLKEQNAEYTVVDFKEQNAVIKENGAMKAYTAFPFDPARGFEAFYIEFDAGCEHYSDKHNDGVEEYVFIVKGKLNMLLNGKEVALNTNQAIRFEANIPHAYLNPYKSTCCVYNMIFYKS